MRITARVLAILLIAQLCACAQFAAMEGNLSQHVEALIGGKQYSRALRALDHGRSGSPEYPELQAQRKRLLELIRAYEQEFSGRAGKHQAQQEWVPWGALIAEAERRIPDSPVFQEEKRRFEAASRAERDRLELCRLIEEGEWLLRAAPLDEELAALRPGELDLKTRRSEAQERASDVARALASYGYEALERDDLDQAQRILPIALRLDPDEDLAAANARLSERLKDRKAKQEQEQRRVKQEQEQRSLEKLLQSIEAAYQAQDLVKGQGLLAQAEALGKDDSRYRELRGRFDKAVAEAIARLQEEGIYLYSQGKFEPALVSWRRVLSLDPNNEQAQVNIIRAERVLDKLQHLREKQVVK